MHQQLQGRSRTVAEDEQSTGERILLEVSAAEGGECVSALPKIDGFDGEQDFQLRNELNHLSRVKE